MFKNRNKSEFLLLLQSSGSKPLSNWDKTVRNGTIKRITDVEIRALVLELNGANVATTFITCPANPKKTLGITLPILTLIVKNLKKYFTFEVQILDDKNIRRRFRPSNFQNQTRIKPFICTMSLKLDDGWNQVQFNLADFTRRAFGTNYKEAVRLQINGNCRLRKVYFADRVYANDQLPDAYKLYPTIAVKKKTKSSTTPIVKKESRDKNLDYFSINE